MTTKTVPTLDSRWDTEKKLCTVHNKPLYFSKTLKAWYCKDCLYSAHLTHKAQKDAIKRYRQSSKGRTKTKEWEHSETGKKARERYLHSEKYKAARRTYNQHLKEALAIARAAHLERAKELTPIEIAEPYAALLTDIREYSDTQGHLPTAANVVKVAKEDYKQTISTAKASELITQALKRGRTEKI